MTGEPALRTRREGDDLPLPFRIRRAGTEDAPALALVGAATFLETFLDLIPGPDLLLHCQTQHSEAAYRDLLSRPQTDAFLAEHPATNAPLGYAVACPPDLPVDTAPDDLELKRIYLFSRAQGSGAATALLRESLAFAREMNAPRLFLGTYEDNARAIRFYEREGFQSCGRRRFRVGHREFDDLVMVRPISLSS